jgi:predicted nuclease of restriction endonuclease-like RecB superfamily
VSDGEITLLTVDLVRARRRGRELVLTKLKGKSRTRARHLAEAYLAVASGHVGATRGAFDEACESVLVNPRERKLALGIRKLVEDECVFEADESVDSRALRKAVFERASAARRALGDAERFDRDALLGEIARERGLGETVEDLLRGLYTDLREANVLAEAPSITATALVEAYELAQAQAALLRATRVVAEVTCKSPATYRYLFGKLKFRRLLCTIRPNRRGGYRIEIDGPYSLFSSVTKYGLQLALLLPALQLCDEWALEAEVLWGKERRPLTFALSGKAPRRGRGARADNSEEDLERDLPVEVAELITNFRKLGSDWEVRPSGEILNLPGLGVCVPDLLFEHKTVGLTVYLEVLGFWSRDAVWRRVELVQAGLPQSILFAVPKRLRVSEEVLDDDLPGSLYVYKGKMSAKAIVTRLDAMLD